MTMTDAAIDRRWFPYATERPAARMRLLCFSYAGLSAALFRPWTIAAPDAIEIVPVQLPGKGARFMETPYSDVDTLVDALSTALSPYLHGRYSLLGCSMGAIIAFELARAVRRRGLVPPLRLFAVARRPPHMPDAHRPLCRLSDDDLIAGLREFDGTPSELLADIEAMRFYLPTIRADFALCESYTDRGEPPLDRPITALGGDADPFVGVEELRGWRMATRGPFTSHIFEGHHFFVQTCSASVLRLVTDTCRADLARLEQTAHGTHVPTPRAHPRDPVFGCGANGF